jgi:uncharacterized membrane protein
MGKNGKNPQPLAPNFFNIQSSAFGVFYVFFHTHVKLFIVILSLLVKKKKKNVIFHLLSSLVLFKYVFVVDEA